MNRILLLLAAVLASVGGAQTLSSKRPSRGKTEAKAATKPAVPARSTASAQTPANPSASAPRSRVVSDEDEQRVYSYKVNTFLGYQVADTTAAALGVQGGFAISRPTPLFLGPEIGYALFSTGRLLTFLGGGWYEMRLSGSPRFSVIVGALGGIGMTDNVGNLKKNVLVLYLDSALSQDIDDLVAIRAQFRPGVVADLFSFSMNLSVSFRFL